MQSVAITSGTGCHVPRRPLIALTVRGRHGRMQNIASVLDRKHRVVSPTASSASKALSDTRALVTGASGFLGTHLCQRLLVERAEVHAVSRSPRRSRDRDGLHWWQCDFVDAGRRPRPDQPSQAGRGVSLRRHGDGRAGPGAGGAHLPHIASEHRQPPDGGDGCRRRTGCPLGITRGANERCGGQARPGVPVRRRQIGRRRLREDVREARTTRRW